MAKTEVEGGWIVLRDPKEVPERLRRPILAKASKVGAAAQSIANGEDASTMVDEDTISGMFEFNDLLAIALVQEWSFDAPVSLDALLDLPSSSYDAIQKVVAPLLEPLMPSFTPDSSNDPKVLTESSGE